MEATEGSGARVAAGSGLLHPSCQRKELNMSQVEEKKPEAIEPAIHIAIDAKGNIVVETVGTTGKQCDLLTGALEASLGQVTARLNKTCYDSSDSM